METNSVIAVVASVVAIAAMLTGGLVKLVHFVIPAQIDRIIEAGEMQSARADERHGEHLRAMKKTRKALSKLRKKKCRKKSSQNGPSRHLDHSQNGKTRPKKPVHAD